MANTCQEETAIISWRECSKKSVQQGRSPFDARSVHGVREHGKRARTPLAAFFNIPIHDIEEGHTVLIVEHHLDVIKCADWVIDLGPGGVESGGHIVAEGAPEEIVHNSHSLTRQFLELLLPLTR